MSPFSAEGLQAATGCRLEMMSLSYNDITGRGGYRVQRSRGKQHGGGGRKHVQTHNRNTHLFRAVLRVLDCVWGTSSDRLSSVCTHAHKHMNKAGAESCTSISCVFNSSAAAVMSLLCDETSLCRDGPFVLSRSPQTDAGSDFFTHVLPQTIKHLHDRWCK